MHSQKTLLLSASPLVVRVHQQIQDFLSGEMFVPAIQSKLLPDSTKYCPYLQSLSDFGHRT